MVKLYIALKQRFVFQKGQGICLKDIATLWSPQGLPKGIEKLRVQQSRPQGMEPVSFVAFVALSQAHYPGYELVQACLLYTSDVKIYLVCILSKHAVASAAGLWYLYLGSHFRL